MFHVEARLDAATRDQEPVACKGERLKLSAMSWRLLLPVAAVPLLFSSAHARPRDDVMSGAFRCAPIAETRTWLDCYYGAAQPQRAALALGPAPTAQLRLSASPPAGVPAPADIKLRDQVMAEAFRCNAFENEKQWLDCYYAAANPARARLGLSLASRSPVPAAPSGSARPTPAAPAQAAAKLSHRMTSYAFDRYGIFTVTLENGEVWRQVSGDSSFARWNKPASRYLVRITRGVLGSFNLEVQNVPGLYKVRRVS
jgi:hypothetical protein